MTLAHRVIGPEGAPSSVFVVHGILGSGRNWTSVARSLVSRLAGWRVVLVDLRGHGDSHGLAPPHDLDACARDLAVLASKLGAPDAVIGHSFGGKVVMQAARDGALSPASVWALDTPPGAAAAGSPGHVEMTRVFEALRSVPQPLGSRGEVVNHLAKHGLSKGIGQWMTTNLRLEDGGYVWRFDLEVAWSLIQSYFREDLWPWLRSGPEGLRFVRGARSDRFDAPAIRRLEELPPPVRVDVLADAGHWVHVDNPGDLLDLLVDDLAELG